MTKCRARIQRWRRRLGVRARDTRGAVLVEFAIIVPILLVPLLVGVLEYGFLWNKVHTLEISVTRRRPRWGDGLLARRRRGRRLRQRQQRDRRHERPGRRERGTGQPP